IQAHIMEDGTIQCAKGECRGLSFGRTADFRRHHNQQHARNRAEYWCTFDDCSRSYVPGGGKTRSFGTRKDKRDEHLRNVHGADTR
ncbi:uncharacterized protein BDR25DRAFT_206593, partial [Lindgomyces ingoldianus]